MIHSYEEALESFRSIPDRDFIVNAVELYREGLNINQVAERTNSTHDTIQRLFHYLGVSRNQVASDDVKLICCRLKELGLTYEVIATITGRSKTQICQWYKKYEIKDLYPLKTRMQDVGIPVLTPLFEQTTTQNKDFSERLNSLIDKSKLSRKELARRSGITETTLSRYTNGYRIPDLSRTAKLAKVLNVTIDYLWNGEE